MPVRTALNVVYALLVDGMDPKDRERFDAELYGLDAESERANRALWAGDDARPETDDGGGESR